MQPPSVRTILPLAAVTCTGMLAMDLYLPAVPAMQRGLALTVPQGQATVAVFLAALAASQLLWGEALHRCGPRACVRWGLVLLAGSSVGCALAPGLWSLLGLRLVQGLGAGAFTVVAPAVIRATLGGQDAVRGLAAIWMIEALVPAAAPVLGAALLQVVDWRGIFAVVAGAAVVAAPFALRAAPLVLPNLEAQAHTGYLRLLRNARYLRLAVAHALCFAALLAFVASAPQVLARAYPQHEHAFAMAQACGVAAFIAVSSVSGRISARLGPACVVQVGAWLHVGLCAMLLAVALVGTVGFAGLLLFWAAFCGTLGLRGPAAFSEVLSVPVAQMGRASALLILLMLVGSAAAAQAVAPFLERGGVAAVACALVVLCAGSLALVARYPRAPAQAAALPGAQRG